MDYITGRIGEEAAENSLIYQTLHFLLTKVIRPWLSIRLICFGCAVLFRSAAYLFRIKKSNNRELNLCFQQYSPPLLETRQHSHLVWSGIQHYNSNFYVRYQKVKIRVIKSTELIDTVRDKSSFLDGTWVESKRTWTPSGRFPSKRFNSLWKRPR